MSEKCKRCGACKECGAVTPPVFYYSLPYWNTCPPYRVYPNTWSPNTYPGWQSSGTSPNQSVGKTEFVQTLC